MKRFLLHDDWCFCAWRYEPVRPATVAEKASSPRRRQNERISSRSIFAAVDYLLPLFGLEWRFETIREVKPYKIGTFWIIMRTKELRY